MIKPSNINKKGKLTHMVADDLFEHDAKQVFNAKTGKWIGTIHKDLELNFDQEEEPEETKEPEPVNPNQLLLF